jgi:glycosyltransferase involved in cell wall biosynthesis
MKKIKVLYTIPNFDTAGSGKVLYDLANGLDKDHFEVHIACNHNRGDFFKEIEKLGSPIHITNLSIPYKPYFSFLNRLNPNYRFVKKHKFDIVHSWHWSSDWTEAVASRLSGAKFIFTKKAMTWGNIHWKIKSFLANYIVTINEEMNVFFQYKKNKTLIPLGVDTEYFNPYFFNPNKDNAKFKICTVANLVPVKKIELIINAIKLLNKSNIYLDIIGDTRDDYANYLKSLVANLNLESQIKFLGKHIDVRSFLADSDLYVISSEKEGMPMALVEAVSMGIPVLGSNIPGINLVLNKFPEMLFESGNVQDLASKIEGVISKSNDERNKISKNLRKHCIENYSMESFVKSHEELYRKLVK